MNVIAANIINGNAYVDSALTRDAAKALIPDNRSADDRGGERKRASRVLRSLTYTDICEEGWLE